MILFYLFNAKGPLLLQNEAETPCPSTGEEYTTGKVGISVAAGNVAQQTALWCRPF